MNTPDGVQDKNADSPSLPMPPIFVKRRARGELS